MACKFLCMQDPLEVVFVKMKAHYLDLGAHSLPVNSAQRRSNTPPESAAG
jgi:hypothetical protein